VTSKLQGLLSLKGEAMSRTFTCMILAIAALMTGLESPLSAQVTPHFVVTISPSIVTVTQGGMASLTVTTVVNERPVFDFSLSGLPSGVIAQVPVGHAGDNTIVLTALAGASTGTFNVNLTAEAGNNPQTQTFVLNVKPMPVAQWEYHIEMAQTQQALQAAAASLGTQSWELVSVVLHPGKDGNPEWVGFFKRQKRQGNQ
jgi:hypothetical protein